MGKIPAKITTLWADREVRPFFVSSDLESYMGGADNSMKYETVVLSRYPK